MFDKLKRANAACPAGLELLKVSLHRQLFYCMSHVSFTTGGLVRYELRSPMPRLNRRQRYYIDPPFL